MRSFDRRDVAGGALLVVCGLAFSSYSAFSYEVGTLRLMGPGMFPTILGVVLSFLGIALIVPAFFRQGEPLNVEFRTPLSVLGGIVSFALLIRPFGLLPAILSIVIISSLAEKKIRPASVAALCVALSLMAWLIFKVGLGLPIPTIKGII